MPRAPKTFKKKTKCFTGTRNPGGKKVIIVSSPNECQEPEPSTSLDSQTEKDSSSKKKVSVHLDKYDKYKGSCSFDSQCNDIVNIGKFEVLLSKIAICNICKGSLSIHTSNRLGLSVNITIKCNSCSYEVSDYNSPKENKSKAEINVRLAYAFRCIGKGEQAAKTVCGIMNLPNPPAFRYYNKALASATKQICIESMREAAEETISICENRDITAIFDGSWQKRGHSSLNGIVSAISGETGKVIDVRVLTKYCRCKKRLQREHEPDCISNYQGSSGGMEAQGILEMFRESETLHGIRYKYYLGDGDSSSYSTVVKAEPYGPDCPVVKKECIGHVQKRMGSRLRRLKKQMGKTVLSDGKTIGGKGRLSNEAIQDMQLYYGLAIRRNVTSLENMKTAIWAEYFHLISTNEHPTHVLCPKTSDTWCKYQLYKIMNHNNPLFLL